MKKVMVVGPCGSGKSTLSRKLRDLLGLPLYHLDNIFWKKDKTHLNHKEMDIEIDKIIKQDKWIIDGDYSYNYKTRMDAADTIIFLDFSLKDCLKAVELRAGQTRSDMPWNDDELDLDFKEYIINWFTYTRPKLLFLLFQYGDKKEIKIYRNREELRKVYW